jgi:DNA-binding response OmpR family regulator
MSHEILIVDDDALLRRSLAFHLEQAGYTVQTSANAEDALATIRRKPPGLVLLDVGLPGMDGLDALKVIKRDNDIPVIFLTARRRELDEVLGLELGGDDYITKPFDVDVLLARVKAVLRRAAAVSKAAVLEKVQVSDLVVDPASRTARLASSNLTLTRREFDLLHALAMQPGVVISTDDLLNQVWGAEFTGQPQVLYTHIRWLREKLEADPDRPQRILTVRGVGYKLVPIDSKS